MSEEMEPRAKEKGFGDKGTRLQRLTFIAELIDDIVR